jgi:hypothetical protein
MGESRPTKSDKTAKTPLGGFIAERALKRLAWLSHKTPPPAEDPARSRAIRDALRTFDAKALADLVTDRATWDDAFFEEPSLSARAREDTRRPTEAA